MAITPGVIHGFMNMMSSGSKTMIAMEVVMALECVIYILEVMIVAMGP